jgi:hypothetical protein
MMGLPSITYENGKLTQAVTVEMDIKAMMLRIIFPWPSRNLIGRDHFAIRWFRNESRTFEIGETPILILEIQLQVV